MKRQILLLAITAAAISSCTTAYRTGQTPDDVYYSPAKPQDEYVRVQEEDNSYRNDDEYYDDRYLRMKVQNRTRWNEFNDWYSYDRYAYRYNYSYGNYWNPYTSWNYYYNPYCTNTVLIVNPKIPSTQNNYSKPRNFNLNTYTNNNYNTANNTSIIKGAPSTKTRTISNPVYNNRNNNSGLSNTIKQIFSGGNNNNNNSSSSSSRSYNPSSSGSSSSSSSGSSSNSSSGSSSGGGTSRPTRGGN